MNVRLIDLTDDDLPLVEQWLRADHVRRNWGDPDTNLRVLQEPSPSRVGQAIIEADGCKVGLVVWQHPTRAELDLAGLSDIPTRVIDIDIMIGEPASVGRGIGTQAIERVAAAALSDPSVPFLIACTEPSNIASQRAFEKAGFRRDREFDDVPNGIHVLMVRQRHEGTRDGRDEGRKGRRTEGTKDGRDEGRKGRGTEGTKDGRDEGRKGRRTEGTSDGRDAARGGRDRKDRKD